jgi:SpoVK/Ycf46/Vps4 family AAA+-type ATPase
MQWASYMEQYPVLKVQDNVRDVQPSCLPSELAGFVVRVSFQDESMIVPHSILTQLYDCQVHVFRLSEEETAIEEIDDGGNNEWTAGCDSLPLPHIHLDGLWESLILQQGLKQRLLDYAQSALLFSDRAVSSHLVHWNRILLLHGLPGTGKTSLCRALAHKLAIRMIHRFPGGATLLDVRAHSLFSKWFSTSGKLVSALFQMVRDMVQDDPTALVCVLVDEVESLASSRSASHGGDPSDAMRAVNSLLTSLDKLRSFPNVLVLATTNLTDSIDAAFVDRVDLKLHIDLPILKARYEILRSCVFEMQRVGIVEGRSDSTLLYFDQRNEETDALNPVDNNGILFVCAKDADGLSGRSLRRLPLQAHAQFLGGRTVVSLEEFLEALGKAIREEQSSFTILSNRAGVATEGCSSLNTQLLD